LFLAWRDCFLLPQARGKEIDGFSFSGCQREEKICTDGGMLVDESFLKVSERAPFMGLAWRKKETREQHKDRDTC
jgi:hypothetical protein